MKIRLSDPDRERLGCPEWLDCSFSLSLREAKALEAATHVEPLEAVRRMVPERQPVKDGVYRWRFTPDGALMLVWLGLHRAGLEVDFEQLDFDYLPLAGWRIEADDEGKAPSPDDKSSTDSKSARSGRSTASKTSKTST